MRLTKYVHACVLVEDKGVVALFDPGSFSYEAGLLKLNQLPKLDYVLITHEHFDHCHQPFIEAIYKKFPNVQFFSTTTVTQQLKGKGINNVNTQSKGPVDIDPLNHDGMAPLGKTPPCENVRFHFADQVTHPGDSIHLIDTKDILLLPLAGPWESTIDAVALADKLKPKIVVPIHDWMWNDIWRLNMYGSLEKHFADQGIKFIQPVNGQPFEV